MSVGPYGEIVGTTGSLAYLGADAPTYKSKVIAPRNPKLIKRDEPEPKLTPSSYLFNMSLNTEQKLVNTHSMRLPRKVELLDMGETTHQKFSQVDIDEPMFQPFPSEIYFQQFEPFQTYEVPLILRNNDKVPRLVKVMQADSPYFKIISPNDMGHKVGPGLPTTFKLQFTPDEKKDYIHELVCVTEREKFVVPVKAIGARAILDFPDDIHFPVCPVKYPNTKTILVRNIGNKEAKFSLGVKKPFSVTPENGVLPVSESMQVTVEFQPTKVGNHNRDLLLHYDTGEDLYISLYGAAQDANVRLDKTSLRIEGTFISMANQRTVTISNRSNVVAHFHWTQYATQEEEDMEKYSYCENLESDQDSETKKFLEECIADPTLRDKLSVLNRTFKNRKRMVEDDKMLFNDDVISIEPVEGDIWPNSNFEVNIIFKPDEAVTYSRTAFCDITGRESRLPLRLRGDGMGPKVQFSFETLDMGNIFIGSVHTYEIILANKGQIDAIYTVLPKHTIFGPCFKFNPSEGFVSPGGHQAIQMTFTSPYLGDFEEDYFFQVDGAPEQLKITFTGSVIGPTFQFDVPKLRFGMVSYGFLNTQFCTLKNTSLVPMSYSLRVPGDGMVESISSTSDITSTVSENGMMSPPKEFEIVPAVGTINPQSEVKIEVRFISNTIKKYEMALVVDVDNVGEEILTLLISAKCIVPAITLLTPIMDYSRCFLRHPYEQAARLHNDTDLPAKYELLPQQVDDYSPILYDSPQPKGIISPHSVVNVPLVIESQALEENEILAYFMIFGSADPPLPIHIVCVGEGPVVHVIPLNLDWNTIPVLQDVPRKILLSNESLISSKFVAAMTRPNSVFRVEPTEGEIPPEETMEITVTANLDDCVRFQDKLQIAFVESQRRVIPLVAIGQGTTIVSDPPLTPVLDLGPNFSNRPLKKTCILTNRGRRHQQLVWSTDGFPLVKSKKDVISSYNALDMKFRNVPAPVEAPGPIFKLSPPRMDLPPGESIHMLLEGFVENPQYVRERVLCHAIIGRQGGKELIIKVDVSTNFISPILDFSSKSIFFRVDKTPEDDLQLQIKELVLTNVSSLPLTTVLKLKYPFQILQDNGTEVSEEEIFMSVGEVFTLQIQFDPAFKDDWHIRTVDEILQISYEEHPHVDYVALRGEVYFPNLDFEKNSVDFGCILNDTEVTRYVNITNNSPMEVKYKWSFLIGNEPCTLVNRRPKSTIPEDEDLNLEEEGESKQVKVQIDEKEEEIGELSKGDLPAIMEEIQKGDNPDDVLDEENINNKALDNLEADVDIPLPDTDRPEKGQLEQEADPEADTDKEKIDRLSLGSRASLREDVTSRMKTPLEMNRVLTALLEDDRQTSPIGIEEVFDILPLYGTLQPGDTEQVTLTFYGHADIWGHAKAICEIEGGPTYELNLQGEASLVEYKFDQMEVNFGKQMFDQVATAEITLINTGKVGFEFTGINMDPALANRPRPGLPVMVPHAGYIEPLSQQTLTIKFLPGVPEDFEKDFNIQVAHFEPDTIRLFGEGGFPRISLDLPRLPDEGGIYSALVKQSKLNLTKDSKASNTDRSYRSLMHGDSQRDESQGPAPSDLEIQMELERLVIKQFSMEIQQQESSDTQTTHIGSRDSHVTSESKRSRKKNKLKAKLPEYILDFGYVVLGTVRTHVVRATNTGYFPASFQVERDFIHNYGFHVELFKVRNLPGAPDYETVDFVVSFDPRGANLPLGIIETVVPLNVTGGPVVCLKLKAFVTMPDMEISDNTLEFNEVKCGECKVVTVQLHNHQHVRCEWNSMLSEKEKKQGEKHLPMHLRRKQRMEKLKPQHFEVMPPTGSLLPGQRVNVQVKFMPTEEKFYEQRIPIRIAQSSQRILLLCRGQGLEPRLDFERNLVEFGPILPHSSGDEQEITIRNPCSFPIEFYNLGFDKGYLEEEKVLRLMTGYDEYNTILLPPRQPADKLPSELMDYYEEQVKKLEEAERLRREAEETAEQIRREMEEQEEQEAVDKVDGEPGKEVEGGEQGKSDPSSTVLVVAPQQISPQPIIEVRDEENERKEEIDEDKLKDNSSSLGVGELEITPVSASIARHLGIDLSNEGKAARNRRGIALIVHGAPMSGKTTTAVMMAKHYNTALLTVDGIVLDAISNGNTPAGLRAREMCSEAARRKADDLRMFEGDEGEKKATGGLSVEALTAHTQGTSLKVKEKQHGSLAGAKTAVNTSSIDGATGSLISNSRGGMQEHKGKGRPSSSCQTPVPSSPPPLAAPIARRLSVSASVAGEEGLLSCVLPEDLLLELLAERIQLNDCHHGVVFDGLETLFSQNLYSTAHAILRALNNRRYIYFVTLKLDYTILKDQEQKEQEEKERLGKEKEEEERLRLEEMSEDEYDALTEEEKAEVDRKRLEIKKERIRKEMEEKAERERREREAAEAELRRLEEERLNKKKGKKGQQQADPKDGKKSVAAGKASIAPSTDRIAPKSQGGPKPHDSDHNAMKVGSSTERPESHQTEKSDTQLDADGKKKKGSKEGKRPGGELGKEKREQDGSQPQVAEEPVRDPAKEAEMLLIQRFRTFEHAQKDIIELVDYWDRTSLQTRRPQSPSDRSEADEPLHPPSGGKKGKAKDKHDKEREKEKERERQREMEREKAERAAREAALAEDGGDGEGQGDPDAERMKDDGIGVPHILVDCADKAVPPGPRVLDSRKLPSIGEVMDGLGLGPHGPPIPPPAIFGVVPYPVKRRPPLMLLTDQHYVFIASSPDDPNVAIDDRPKEPDIEEEKSVTPDKNKDDHMTPTKGKGGKEKLKAGSETKERKKSADRKKIGRRGSMQVPSPPPGAVTPVSDVDAQSTTGESLAITEPKTPKLSTFRWIVPANGEILIRLRFQSEELGQFDQTMNFEIVGTRRRYQLFCRGICAFPTISREPRIVFPHRKKSKKFDEIVHKKYVLSNEIFEFGPLLVGKSRDKYKEGKYPENMEKIQVLNTSPLEADISFSFLNDSKGETYLLDPPSMCLKPGESQELTTWAYPKVPGHYDDAIVCCVRENPEPIIFKVCCDGFRPELELDKKQLHFDKVLLHRKDTKTVFLRNSTHLPVAWKLSGLENLGDDFTVAADSGVVDPKSEYGLHAYFRAMKPVQTNKKMIRLEISDVDNIMGVVHTEAIQVIAEAYDVALDMSFPKGTDGGIDFGTIRVSDETKQQCTLKNKGKYEISYAFFFENCDTSNPDVTSLFSVIPQKGTLSPIDRPQTVQVIFRSRKEITVKEQPLLKCQIIEPNIAEGGEVIASIPVKVSVKAVFSKFNILPVNDINFGSLLVNSKKTRTFVIENKGEFDFKYTITKMIKEAIQAQSNVRQPRQLIKGDKRTKSRDGSSSGRSIAKPRKTESISDASYSILNTPRVTQASVATRKTTVGGRPEAGASQSRLILGMFTVFPAFGIILPNGHQTITVDCVAEQQGRCDEEIAIDITDRDPTSNSGGISYRLLAEACIPSINIDDVGSIFEEHLVCKNLNLWQHSNQQQEVESSGIFGEDERRFVFNNVIVGRKAKARFKISNMNKVPCDVAFTVKPLASKGVPKNQEIFEVDPPRSQIPNHSYVYATVTFTPPSMQTFGAVFEATIEGLSQTQARGRSLVFDLSGEGNFPRVTIAKPTVRNKRGQPLLLFKRILLSRTEALALILTNDGTLPSKVDIDLIDPDDAFSLRPTGDTRATLGDIDSESDASRRPHTASVVINVGEKATFHAIFRPSVVQRSQAHIRLAVMDNQYEDSVIQLVGEGYEDDISLDNIHSVSVPIDPENEEGNMAEDDVPAAKPNLLKFGDCYINEPRTLTFTMTNHSKVDCIRFQWPEHGQLKFSPMIGHLPPATSKDMTVTFKSDSPKTLPEYVVQCKVVKIAFDKSVHQVSDWDDRIRTVKWMDVPPTPVQTADSNKSHTPTPTTSRPTKRKVVETEPEPQFTEIPESVRNVELLVSAIADYCKFKCKTESVHFKDTLMFQTRVFDLTVSNKGSVQMDYNWQFIMDTFTPLQRSVTFYSDGDRPESRVSVGAVNDTSYVPFTITPEFGTILPGKKATCKVKFSPLDVNDYEGRLICSIPNLEKNEQGPVVGLKARSLMPYCHFDLEDSDYITSARRNPEMRGPGGAPPGSTLDPNTQVIEFSCIGIEVKKIRKFNIMNPTNTQFTFEWICDDDFDPKRVPAFQCLTPKGLIRPGKKFEVVFEFVSSEAECVESFWSFTIPDQNISVPFLLVGSMQEPAILMDRSHLNFKSLLISHEAIETVYLINGEDQPFNFSFLEDSCHSAGYSAHLKVVPMSGVIPGKSRTGVNLHYTPATDKEVNFNLICNIRKKVHPVTLNVKAEGYSMNCTLLCENSVGNKIELSDKGLNELNFGDVEVNEQAMRNLQIINSGKFNFDFNWELNERTVRKDMMRISPKEGGVMFGEKQKCVLTFCPPCKTSLRGCELILRISNGPVYTINVVGLGVAPGLHFSFQSFNFGSCFIHRAGMPTHSKVLKLTNKDRKEISVDCLYEPTNHLHHNFEARVIAPGESVNITFTFYPREAIKYQETITFEINGLSKQSININGQGTEMKVEVADPKQKIINFGARYVRDTIKKYIPIVNNSPAPITFNIALTPSQPALQQPGVLTISPTNTITLEPRGGTSKVEIIFAPKSRIPQFAEEILLECAGLYQPLFVVQGSCLGMEITLDTEAIPFGAVVQRSQSSRKVVMTNSGDMNAKFKWDGSKFSPDFSITPAEGYIAPGMEVTFEITFHPQEVNQDVRYENLKCLIQGGPHRPVTLTLTGMCIGVPPVKDVQHFSTHVRQKEVKNLLIPNRTNQLWHLKPIIDGEFWTGSVTFTVDPQQTRQYELTYKPLTMTAEGKKHMGSVFFPLPDGTGLLYNVTGVAEPPKYNGRIVRDIPCKTSYTESLTVHNWLKKPQRFRVRSDPVKMDKLDPGTIIKGMEYIDVPASGKKEYKLSFYAHREGSTQLKVTFTNEQSGEYQFYETTFRATRPGIISTIDLSTPVRQSVPYTIILENPLPYAVTFGVTCNVPEILMPGQLNVPAQAEGRFNFEYQPLKVGESQGRVEFNCNDLGLYLYDLNLKATPAGPEKALYFRTCLGQNQVHVARFLNFAKQKTDYVCKVDNTDFHVDKTVAAAPGSTGGTEVAVDVTFEPSHIGEQRALLTIASPVGGEYTFPLFGTCIPPKPQGPYLVKAGATTSIIFRNVFSSTTAFSFQVDNPLFHLVKQGESIRSHKDHRIAIGFDGNDSGSKAGVMGKLVITCPRSAGGNSNVQWVFYLKGYTP